MSPALIGKKIGMTQLFTGDGTVKAVTAIEAGPCTVTQVKTKAKEGYDAIQIGFGDGKLGAAEKGHLAGLGNFRHLREIRVNNPGDYRLGAKLDVSLFKAGERVDIIGVSKGKGFAGVVKRHHFSGGPKTHGQSDRHRAPGAIGSTTYPGHVYKNLRMAGHMGSDRVTALRIEVAGVDAAKNLLLIEGSVPGADNGLVLIKKSSRRKR